MNRLLIGAAIFSVAAAFLSVIWIVLPAPSAYVWLYSVAVGEWSLWFGALALFGIACAILNHAFYKNAAVLYVALFLGVAAFSIALYPFFSACAAARAKNVSLSIGDYFGGVGRTEKINFETRVFARAGETDLKLDVYRPPDGTARNGAGVIVVHGGSWSGGARSDFPQWNRWLAENGFVVFDIDYRLAPQPNYRAAIGDVKCAVKWVKSHAAEFNLQAGKLILFGRSAGAQLALIAGYSAGDEKLPASCNDSSGEDETVRAVVAFYAPTDLIWDYDHPANQRVIDGPQTLAGFLGGDPHAADDIAARYRLASPTATVDSKTPPTLLVHGGQDQLVRAENLDILAAQLDAFAVRHETLKISYAQHGFDYNFHGWGSQVARAVTLDFLRENLRDKID